MDKRREVTWTDEDQARHIASIKRDLAELLKNADDFRALQAGPVPSHMTPEECALYLLRLYVSGLRSEIVAWCEGGQP
jgi:hypothetical protein